MPEKSKPQATAERLCFVIGPIGEAASSTRKHADMLLNAIIRPTVEPLGYRVKRADEDPTPGMISDAMLLDLRNAELVIADLSELNPNAFYELGIRHAYIKPTIHMAVEGMRLPFDNAGYRAIRFDLSDWNSHQRTCAELKSMVRAIQAPGFKPSNPITHANAMAEIRESSDTPQQVIREILNRLAALEATNQAATRVLTRTPGNPAISTAFLNELRRQDKVAREPALAAALEAIEAALKLEEPR